MHRSAWLRLMRQMSQDAQAGEGLSGIADSGSIGPHTYSFRDGILRFVPSGEVQGEHVAGLVLLLRRYGQSEACLQCLFEPQGSPRPTPEARRLLVEYLRTHRQRLNIATCGATLPLRTMISLVSAAARVLGGYQLQVTHFDDREAALQFLQKSREEGASV